MYEAAYFDTVLQCLDSFVTTEDRGQVWREIIAL